MCINLVVTKYDLKSQYAKFMRYVTLNCQQCQSGFSVLSGKLFIKLSKICFLCTHVNQMITQLQFYNIYTNFLSMIYELPKIRKYCQILVLTIIIYKPIVNYHIPTASTCWTILLLTLFLMHPRAQRTLLGVN